MSDHEDERAKGSFGSVASTPSKASSMTQSRKPGTTLEKGFHPDEKSDMVIYIEQELVISENGDETLSEVCSHPVLPGTSAETARAESLSFQPNAKAIESKHIDFRPREGRKLAFWEDVFSDGSKRFKWYEYSIARFTRGISSPFTQGQKRFGIGCVVVLIILGFLWVLSTLV